MATDHERVKALFLAAIERSNLADRQAFLHDEVGDDLALRDRLDALLAAYEKPPGTLDRPLAVDPHTTDGTQSLSSPHPVETHDNWTNDAQSKDIGSTLIDTVIADRYKLRQEIGEGGMGTVYLAEQLRPVRRQVALKLIKRGMDSRNVLARFESERQALALMDHPHIARVLDAGSTADGRPFFVMELVKGIPITDYCDAHRLDIPARLALFRQVCSAVQHAHQKGIIHRDLKPSNILVEAHDDKPVPKVIDFGRAKATSGMRLSDHSLFTAFGSVAGTPRYMAPEQAAFNALDVDTRADIYALGVILYELLTGSTPITRESLQRAALDEMLRVIREVDPPTPSSRLSTSEALPSLAASRHVEPARLSRLVRGELDWIVMKALAKERDRRYASAVGLADDLERHLNHEAVSAGPPTTAYRLRKFVRRNRVQVGAAAVVLLALVLGVVGTTLGLIEARRQEAIAIREAKEKEEARRAETDQRQAADLQRGRAERGLAQVTKMNDILGSIFKDLDPRNVAKEGKPLTAVLGERLDRATAEIEGEATGDPLAVARMQMTLGRSQLGLGYPDRAIGLYTRARATFASDPRTFVILEGQARCLANLGQFDKADALLDQVIASRRKTWGDVHPETLRARLLRAEFDLARGRLDAADAADRAILEECRTRLGADEPATITVGLALARVREARGDRAAAAPLYRTALESARKNPTDRETLAAALTESGRSRLAAGDWSTAEAELREAVATRESQKPQHWRTAEVRSLLGATLLGQNKTAGAAPLLRSGYEGMARSAAAIPLVDRPRLAEALDRLIAAGEAAGAKAEVEAWKAERAKLATGGPKP
jgi:serine/threonine protein kinase